jgi:hypothetical protein
MVLVAAAKLVFVLKEQLQVQVTILPVVRN